jgi:prefoldin subunit 5
MEQQLADNEVGSLQSRLAELGTNLDAIMAAQAELLTIRDRIATVEKTNSETILKVDSKIQALDGVDSRLKRIQKDVDDAWRAMDELANPLGR